MATKKQIDAFLGDPDVLELIQMQREQRLLFITDLSETRVSALLAWLFRPHEGHGLGDSAVRELLLNIWRASHQSGQIFDFPALSPTEVLKLSLRDLIVVTEYQVTSGSGGGRGRSVDILLVSRQSKLMVAIENKFGSLPHDDQLKSYRNELMNRYQDFRKIFVYLDSNEENEPDDDQWISLDYGWLVELIANQQRIGILSDRALDAMDQLKAYLNQEVAVSDDESMRRTQLLEAVAANHSAVVEIFSLYSKEKSSHLMECDYADSAEPLLIEFCQRRALWSELLRHSKHAVIVAPLKKIFGDKLEVHSMPAEVVFRFRHWAENESDTDGYWGARVSAWSGRDGRSTYDVWAGIFFENIRSECEADLRLAAKRLRSPSLKAAPKEARWVLLSKTNERKPTKAVEEIADLLQRVDKEISHRHASK